MKCVVRLLLLFSLLFNFGILCYGFNAPRIINGVFAPPDKYHNVVRIVSLQQFGVPANAPAEVLKTLPPMSEIALSSCTGSIISKRHILTAAHCVLVTRLQKKKMIVPDLGFLIEYIPIIPDRETGGKISLAKYAIVADFEFHKEFKWQSFQHDIAIIEFPKDYDLKIDPVILAKNYEEGVNDVGVNVGFGDTDPAVNVSVPPKALLQIQLPILPKADCKANDATHPIICAGTPTHRSDHGDSGGPLFYNGTDGKQYQIGIVSSGSMKNGTDLPDDADMAAYMRVSYYCDWIKEKTNGEAECVEMGKAAPTEGPIQPEIPSDAPIDNIPTAAPLQSGNTTTTTTAPSGGNGKAMSKNIFIILFSFIFAFVLILY